MYNPPLIICFLIGLFLSPRVLAQESLDRYIEEGIQSNRVLQEKNVNLERSILALKTAKSYYLPSLELGGSYIIADGGRTIDLPIGDLLNPVYGTLNELTDSDQFPMIENQQEQFFPNDFYDVRFRLSYPIVNTDRHYGKQIRKKQVEISQLEIEVYKADLIRDIKQAYYNYAIAETAYRIFNQTLVLVERNLRNNQSLLKNGSGLPAYVLRAESEVEDVKFKIKEAEVKRKNAGQYLNFLVNKPLDTPIEYESPDLENAVVLLEKGSIDLRNRAELKQIELAENINALQISKTKAFIVPDFNAFLDLGAQDFEFNYRDQSNYYFFGLQMSVPIFSGNRNNLAIRSGRETSRILALRRENTLEQLSLSAETARNNIITATSALDNARKKRSSSRSYFKLIETGFREGKNAYIEYLDARNQLTNAELDVALTYFQLLSSQAIFERELTMTTNSL